jgi:hypothetical protein
MKQRQEYELQKTARSVPLQGTGFLLDCSRPAALLLQHAVKAIGSPLPQPPAASLGYSFGVQDGCQLRLSKGDPIPGSWQATEVSPFDARQRFAVNYREDPSSPGQDLGRWQLPVSTGAVQAASSACEMRGPWGRAGQRDLSLPVVIVCQWVMSGLDCGRASALAVRSTAMAGASRSLGLPRRPPRRVR